MSERKDFFTAIVFEKLINNRTNIIAFELIRDKIREELNDYSISIE